VFMKTLNYTQRFSKYKNRETISAVRRYFSLLLLVDNDVPFSAVTLLVG